MPVKPQEPIHRIEDVGDGMKITIPYRISWIGIPVQLAWLFIWFVAGISMRTGFPLILRLLAAIPWVVAISYRSLAGLGGVWARPRSAAESPSCTHTHGDNRVRSEIMSRAPWVGGQPAQGAQHAQHEQGVGAESLSVTPIAIGRSCPCLSVTGCRAVPLRGAAWRA